MHKMGISGGGHHLVQIPIQAARVTQGSGCLNHILEKQIP